MGAKHAHLIATAIDQYLNRIVIHLISRCSIRQCFNLGLGVTPTEILTAWEAGADIVKVFPADVGGPAYFKAIKGPLPQIRLMPTGGVNLDTAKSFLDAGACALGAGGSLIPKSAIENRDMQQITSLAKQFVDIASA